MKVFRGEIVENNWYYSGDIDALIINNTGKNPVLLSGFSIFKTNFGANINYKIYKNDILVLKSNNINTRELKIYHNFCNEIIFQEPIIFNINDSIELVLQQVNIDRNELCSRISNGEENIQGDNICINISKSTKSTNSTNICAGAFPYFIFDRYYDMPLNIYCEKNHYDLHNFYLIKCAISFISIKYFIDSDKLNQLYFIFMDLLEYSYDDKKCKKCKNIILELDVVCKGTIHHKNKYIYENCKGDICEECINKNIIYKLEKYDNILDEENIDLHDPDLFIEEIDKYELLDTEVCDDCYMDNKKKNKCYICEIIYSADTKVILQECYNCKIKICRLCHIHDFENNLCNNCI